MNEKIQMESDYRLITRVLLIVLAVLLVLALYPYTEDPAAPVKRLFLNVFLGCAALAGVWGAWKGRARVHFQSPLTALLAVFFLVQLVASLRGGYPEHSLRVLQNWTALLLLAFLAMQAWRKAGEAAALFTVLVCAVSLASIYGFLQRAGCDPFPWAQQDIEEYLGLPSTFANPNFAGHALVLAIVPAFGMAVWRRGWRRLFFLCAGLLMCGHLYLTHMRGGRLALLAALGVVLLFQILRGRLASPLRAALITVLAGLLLAVLAVAAVAGWAALADSDTPLPADSSVVLRLNGYYGAARMLSDHPADGVGPGNFARFNIPYWTPYEAQWFGMTGKRNAHVHCDVLEMGVESGIPGVLVYSALMSFAILAALLLAGSAATRELRLTGLILAAAFTAFAVDGLFGFNSRVPASAGIFFLFLGVLEGIRCRDRAPDPGEKKSFAALAMQIAVVLIALFLLIGQLRVFRAERLYQQARGALEWAEEFRQSGRADQVASTLEQADELLARGGALLPDDKRFPESRAVIRFHQQKPASAAEFLREALGQDPAHPVLGTMLAQALLNLAQDAIENRHSPEKSEEKARDYIEKAREHLDAAELDCAYLPEVWEAKGRAALLRANTAGSEAAAVPDWETAMDCYRNALRYGIEDRAGAQRSIAQAAMKRGRPEDAARALKAAAESDPAASATWKLFQAFREKYDRRGIYVDALSRALGRLRARDPVPENALADVTALLAEEYMRAASSRELAVKLLRDALARSPEQADLWGLLLDLTPPEKNAAFIAELLESTGTGPEIRQRIPQPVQMVLAGQLAEPEQLLSVARSLEAYCNSKLREGADARALRRETMWIADLLRWHAGRLPADKKETAVRILAHAGAIYTAAGRWTDAAPVFAGIAADLPGDLKVNALAQYSRVLAELDDAAGALRLAEAAVEAAPENPAVRWNYARRLAEAGRLAGAEFEYTSLIGQAAHDPVTLRRMQEELAKVRMQREAAENTLEP
jgi:O-antigen ligase/predicted Zn-dependent protease